MNKELHHLGVVHAFHYPTIYFAQHKVAFLVFEWIMKPAFRDRLKTLYKRLRLFLRGVWQLYHWFSSHWINQIYIILCTHPLAVHKIVSLVFYGQRFGVYSSKCFKMVTNGPP